MRARKFKALFLLIVIGHAANSASALVKDFVTPEPAKLNLNLPQAVVTLNGTAQKTLQVKITGAPDLELESALNIETLGPVVSVSLKEGVSPLKLQVEITGSSSAEIHLFEGSVQLSRWPSEALVHLQKGKIVSREGRGTLSVHSQKGEVDIVDHKAKFWVDSFGSQVNLRSAAAGGQIENFMGATLIEKSEGDFVVKQSQGSFRVQGSSGTLQFETNKGQMNVLGFSGRVEGQSQEGSITVNLNGESDVEITAKAGRVNLNSGGLGAYVNVATNEGDLFVPAPLKINSTLGGSKSFKGRLKGQVQKGEVHVRAQEASIQVR